jgi:hypothetical protein
VDFVEITTRTIPLAQLGCGRRNGVQSWIKEGAGVGTAINQEVFPPTSWLAHSTPSRCSGAVMPADRAARVLLPTVIPECNSQSLQPAALGRDIVDDLEHDAPASDFRVG